MTYSLKPITGRDFEHKGYGIKGAILLQHVEEAIDVLEAGCVPLEKRAIIQELTTLAYLTKRRNETQDDLKLTMAAYADALGQFPMDAVVWAIREWPKYSTWWPSLHELIEAMPLKARRRMEKLEALRKYRKSRP